VLFALNVFILFMGSLLLSSMI